MENMFCNMVPLFGFNPNIKNEKISLMIFPRKQNMILRIEQRKGPRKGSRSTSHDCIAPRCSAIRASMRDQGMLLLCTLRENALYFAPNMRGRAFSDRPGATEFFAPGWERLLGNATCAPKKSDQNSKAKFSKLESGSPTIHK
jgi:hypothetical protein